MGHIIAIDPGNDTGWAMLINGMVVWCGVTKPERLSSHFIPRGGKMIIECPQIYPHERDVDPNDLIKLAIKVGRATEMYENYMGLTVYQTFPRQWKKQVPKDVHKKRIEDSLTEKERAVVIDCLNGVSPSIRHNGWDAVGLGVWFAKKEKERAS